MRDGERITELEKHIAGLDKRIAGLSRHVDRLEQVLEDAGLARSDSRFRFSIWPASYLEITANGKGVADKVNALLHRLNLVYAHEPECWVLREREAAGGDPAPAGP